MIDYSIRFPKISFKNYINFIYKYCKDKGFSLIVKGSLAKGTAKKHSDIDLVILGYMTNENIDEIISLYDTPVMTNFTKNPKGIFIIIYENGICVDIDLRNTVLNEELKDSIVLLKNNSNFVIDNEIIRKIDIQSKFLPERPEWYKVLRLIHRSTIKYLCNKTSIAEELLLEIQESLEYIDIRDLNFKGNFKEDIIQIFYSIYYKYDFDYKIRNLFENLFKELK